MGLLGKANEIIIIKHIAQCLAQSKHSINVHVSAIINVDCQISSDPHQEIVVSGLSAGTWKHSRYIGTHVAGRVIKTGSSYSLWETEIGGSPEMLNPSLDFNFQN